MSTTDNLRWFQQLLNDSYKFLQLPTELSFSWTISTWDLASRDLRTTQFAATRKKGSQTRTNQTRPSYPEVDRSNIWPRRLPNKSTTAPTYSSGTSTIASCNISKIFTNASLKSCIDKSESRYHSINTKKIHEIATRHTLTLMFPHKEAFEGGGSYALRGLLRLHNDPPSKQDKIQCIHLKGLKLLSINLAVNNFRWPDHELVTFSSPASPVPERMLNTHISLRRKSIKHRV